MRSTHAFSVATSSLIWLAFAASGVFFVASDASAQNQGFALNRFDIAEVGSDWFAGDSLDFRGELRPGARLGLDWAHKPLLRYDRNGDPTAAVIENQLFGHVGAGLILADRVRLGANLPILLAQDGEPVMADGMRFAAESGAAMGDLRLAADVRLIGKYGDPLSLAVGLQAHLPTGDRAAFAGDGKVRLVPRAMVAGDIAWLAYSVRAGFSYRPQNEGFGPVPTGHELSFVATAGVRLLDGALLLGPELWGSTTIDEAAFERETTPFEVVFGAHYENSGFSAGLGAGPGLNRGLGAPEFRVLATLSYLPVADDRDDDGIIDPEDACPDTPGARSDDPAKNGCPDRDGDGITDPEDACPDTPGPPSSDPEMNGCPDRDDDGIIDPKDACPDVPGSPNDDPALHGCPDRDGDSIIDPEDACPDIPGPPNDDPDLHGCPDRDGDSIIDPKDACPDTPGAPSDNPALNGCPDRDGDGIFDKDDACPDVVGVPSEDPEKHGCPLARVEEDQIVISQRIEFEFDSAKLVPSSTPVLEAVLEIMQEHPEIESVLVEGHTDNVGKPEYNKKLSRERAKTVVDWLVDHGIHRDRLQWAGRGQEEPIASNEDEVGRQKNRRVEFHILEGAASDDASDEASTDEAPQEFAPVDTPESSDGSESEDDPFDW